MDLTALFTGLIGLVGGIVLSIVGNLLTDPVRDWLTKQSLVSKNKRTGQLQKDLEVITNFYNERDKFYLHLFRRLFGALNYMVGVLLAMIGGATSFIGSTLHPPNSPEKWLYGVFGLVLCYISAIFSYLFFTDFLKTLREISRVDFYDKFKEDIEKKIAELSNSKP